MWLVCLPGAVLHGSGLCRRRWTVSTSKPRGWSCRARLCKSWHGPTRPLARPPPTTKPTLPPLRVLRADVYLRPPSGRGWSRAADDVRTTTTKEPMRTLCHRWYQQCCAVAVRGRIHTCKYSRSVFLSIDRFFAHSRSPHGLPLRGPTRLINRFTGGT